MTELQELAKGNVLVLVPMRCGKRLLQNDVRYPSHSFIPLKQLGLIGRPQLFSCLYAACGCDENKMIGSSQNKCPECQEITRALGSYISRKTLEILPGNNIRCRGGRNASVSVGNFQASSNESWSEQIQLRNGMCVSFSTNFENKMQQDNNLHLSFEVVSVPAAPRHSDTFPKNQRERITIKKRPPEYSTVALLPCKVAKSPDPSQRKHKPEECHKDSLPLRSSLPLPMPDTRSKTPTNTSIEQNELKESNEKTNLEISCSIDVATRHPIINHQEDDTSVNLKLMSAKKRRIQQAVEPTPNEVAHLNEKQLKSTSFGNAPCVVTEPQIANQTSDNVNLSSDKFQPRLFFCPLGQDMSKGIIGTLSDSVEKLGGSVVNNLEASTHMVVSSTVSSWEKVANRLGMEEKDLRSLLSFKNIKAITPKWIRSMAADGALRKPVPSETWMLVTTVRAEKKKRKNDESLGNGNREEEREFSSNREVAQIFRELGELYQDCPLEMNDMWRAYQFRINAGRVKLLPFELSLENLGRLRKDVTGFGASCIEIIQQYLESGQVERIHKLKTDRRRVAMHNMMEIWGVGGKAALRLINDDCSSIEDVRRRLSEKTLFLDRNQLVGVDCYEDIMQRMSRPEVVEIGEIIQTHVLKLFPGAEVKVMGSYRRGKETCGDVDVHITSNDHRTKIPKDALGRIVDSLWRDGHIAFHLTVLYGMETGYKLCDYQRAGKNLDPSVWETSKPLRPPTTRSAEKSHASYMGCFNSPTNIGTRRRVDIKFYPYRERVFASLYFTGNGFFNRSMRLWARQRGWQLNDAGLFKRGTKQRILDASEEKQVFDMLDLVYKHPHERDSFDALEPKTGQKVDYEPTQGEFKEDAENKWIE